MITLVPSGEVRAGQGPAVRELHGALRLRAVRRDRHDVLPEGWHPRPPRKLIRGPGGKPPGCLGRRSARYPAEAEPGTRGARCAVLPVDLDQLARVPQRRESPDDAEGAGADHIARVADVDVAAGEVVKDPALPLAVGLAGTLPAGERAEWTVATKLGGTRG